MCNFGQNINIIMKVVAVITQWAIKSTFPVLLLSMLSHDTDRQGANIWKERGGNNRQTFHIEPQQYTVHQANYIAPKCRLQDGVVSRQGQSRTDKTRPPDRVNNTDMGLERVRNGIRLVKDNTAHHNHWEDNNRPQLQRATPLGTGQEQLCAVTVTFPLVCLSEAPSQPIEGACPATPLAVFQVFVQSCCFVVTVANIRSL